VNKEILAQECLPAPVIVIGGGEIAGKMALVFLSICQQK
jgi:pyruvate/2-oxoglutarate dehydrogenase complex dihydrolipoamide dehydrogenase (E3) component